MIKIEFPADRPDIACALGEALLNIAGQMYGNTPAPTERPSSASIVTSEEVTALMTDTSAPEYTPDPKQPDSLFPGEAGGTAAAAGEAETSTTSPAGASAPLDTKGVGFNAEYCGQAAQPFYGSGKRSGQWKKRKGVDDDDYDAWYAGELGKLQASPANQAQAEVGEDDHQPAPVNTGAAFGNQQQQPPASAPQDTGSFMGWVSEKQAAGLLSQADVQEAYTQAAVQVTDLFPPNDAAAVAQRIGALYGVLSAKAGA